MNLSERLYYQKFIDINLYLLVFFIPIWPLVANLLAFLYVLVWVAGGGWQSRISLLKERYRRINLLFFILLFLGLLTGVLYSSNTQGAWFDLQVKLPLFLCPLVLSASIRKITLRQVIFILKFFSAGAFIATLICYQHSVSEYFTTGSALAFYYKNLSFYHHPSYLALYVCFSVAFLLYILLEEQIPGKAPQVLIQFFIIYFVVFIVLLSSKAGILGLFLIISVYGLIYFVLRNFKWKTLWLIFPILLALLVSLIAFPLSGQRFEVAQTYITGDNKSSVTDHSVSERMVIWDASLALINDHYLYGVGTGDVKDELYNQYLKMGNSYAAEMKLNAHNQFLQTFIAIGFTGFGIIVLILLYPLILAIQRGRFLFLVFILLIILNFLVESMLERQEGVLFYVVMNTLLFIWMIDPDDQPDLSSLR